MQLITKYVAADGKQFDCQKDCLDYEVGLENEKNIHCFTNNWGDWEEIDASSEHNFIRSDFIVFDNRAAAEWYKKKMEDRYLCIFGDGFGYKLDDYEDSEYPIAFIFNNDTQAWVDWTERQEFLQRQIDEMTSLVYNKKPF